MPFIQPDRRVALLANQIKPAVVGDLCYLHYWQMVHAWKRSPRWTTAHNIYKSVQRSIFAVRVTTLPSDEDNVLAKELAWQVFFQLYVMPYEIQKRQENGDI